jgi:ribosomal-protein-alanine N-acetyltransferase
MNEQPTLHTGRLTLRPFRLSDAKEVQTLAGDHAVADTTLLIPHPYEDGMAERWISTLRGKYEIGELADFAIVLSDADRLIGAVGLKITRKYKHAELGYWIGRPFWGQGYCTEATRAVTQYAFGELGLVRIYANHFARNPASGRVMEKTGMLQEGAARQHVKKWGTYEDIVLYGMSKGEV